MNRRRPSRPESIVHARNREWERTHCVRPLRNLALALALWAALMLASLAIETNGRVPALARRDTRPPFLEARVSGVGR